MKLQPEEQIIKVYHHDFFNFILRGIKIWCASLPFFLMVYFFSKILIFWTAVSAFGGVFVLFGLIHTYDFMMFYLDTLVITNQRVVHLDWISPFKYNEVQAMLDDIQNIESDENGFLSMFKIFDFGLFLVETASTKTIIRFDDAPDPEAIKFFLVNLSRKHAAMEEHIPECEADPLVVEHKKIESDVSKVASVD